MKPITRRTFIAGTAVAAALPLSGCGMMAGDSRAHDFSEPPPYLAEYAALYRTNPREAARAWFGTARFGLFMHYGLYALLGRHEWVQLRENIPLAEYEKLKDRFTAKDFDADFITGLAIDAGMKYITITSKHHEGFSLFATKENDYNAMDSPCGRDLIAQLSEACYRKGLGLFLYYSYAADWHHPWFYPPDAGWVNARPPNWKDEPRYLWRRDADFKRYVAFVHAQLRELLTGYGPIAGIWFDPIMGYYARPDLFPMEETYALVRSLQPQTLISFKQGATGSEDFAAPERSGYSLADRVAKTFPERPESERIARRAWESNRIKKVEYCDTLQPRGWGYIAADDGNHKTPDQVMEMLTKADENNANLLLNTGPLPDGGIHPEDIATLREVGKRLKRG